MYAILSLSGGGIRGVYQAQFLKNIAESFPVKPLCNNFNLIAGTSTGSIIAAAVAFEVPLRRIIELFEKRGPEIFSRKRFSDFRSGPRYSAAPLREELGKVFGARTLKEATRPLLITSTVLFPYFKERAVSVFREPGKKYIDPDLKIADIVLASCAAPTYFEAVQMEGDTRTYVDGGMWANSPALDAVVSAFYYERIPLNEIRLLGLGNGEAKQRLDPKVYRDLRPVSPLMIRSVIDMMFAAQSAGTQEMASMLLPDGNCLFINPDLTAPIALDDVKKALADLPPRAQSDAADYLRKIGTLFGF